MPEKPDNDILSQDALDALMASVQADSDSAGGAEGEGFSDPVSEISSDDDASGLISDAGFDVDPAAFDDPSAVEAATLKLHSFDDPAESEHVMQSMDRVNDIPLELTVELGRTKLLIKDILDLSSGSIVELEKMAGEPVDLLANGVLIARGEVVVIEDSFGVRITELITYADRKAIANDPTRLAA
jgi:flagellar motor switch protein FliN/FliY